MQEVEKLTSKGFRLTAAPYGKANDKELCKLLQEFFKTDKPCEQLLKRPIGSWQGGEGTAIIKSTSDFHRLLRKFGRLNIGLYLDKLAVLDVDDITVLEDIKIPQTFTVRTGGGGLHLYFKVETEEDKQIIQKFKGVWWSAEGRKHSEVRLKWEEHVIIPPSMHPSGNRYEVEVATSPINASETLPFFEALRAKLEASEEQGEVTVATATATTPTTTPATDEERIRKAREILESLGFHYEDIPPCIRSALEHPSVHNTSPPHIPNTLVLFFFRTLGVSAEDFIRLWLTVKVDATEKETRQQVTHWDKVAHKRGKGYLAHNCEKLQSQHLCPGCEFKGRVKNPLTAYWLANLRRCNVEAIPLEEEWEIVPESVRYVFPFERARPGQIVCIEDLRRYCSLGKKAILRAETGYGKSAIIVTLAKLLPHTLIIEPQKGLQDQIQHYGVFVLKGRSAYKCAVTGDTADKAPCLQKSYECEEKENCSYKKAWREAIKRLRSDVPMPVCANHGLYRFLRQYAKHIIFDEFDVLCEQLGEEIWLRSCKEVPEPPEKALYTEIREMEAKLQDLKDAIDRVEYGSKEFYRLAEEINKTEARLNRLELFAEGEFLVFERSSRKWRGKRVYAKMEKEACANLLLREKCVGVSATPPPVSGAEVVSPKYEVNTQENAPIVYLPIVKLTTRESTLVQNANIRVAAETLLTLMQYIRENEGEGKKFIVHCGNTKQHMLILREVLEQKFKTLTHERGRLEQIIKEFKERDYDVLLVAAADVGYDFFEYHYQFIFKIPYTNRNDPEWKAIEQKYGKEQADVKYHTNLVNRIVQICGRICRGREDYGITFILDAKFGELYESHYNLFPESFRNRLILPQYIEQRLRGRESQQQQYQSQQQQPQHPQQQQQPQRRQQQQHNTQEQATLAEFEPSPSSGPSSSSSDAPSSSSESSEEAPSEEEASEEEARELIKRARSILEGY